MSKQRLPNNRWKLISFETEHARTKETLTVIGEGQTIDEVQQSGRWIAIDEPVRAEP